MNNKGSTHNRTASKSLIYGLLALLIITANGDRAAANTASERAFEFYQDALARLNAGDVKSAIIQLKNAIQQDPRDIPTRLLLAKAYLKGEQGAAAERELVKAQRDGAHKNFILPLLGRAQLYQKKYKSFLSEFPIRRDISEIEPEMRIIRGLAHFALHQLKLADREFSAALTLAPDSWEAHLGIAKVQIARGYNELAVLSVNNAAKIAPTEPEIWFLSGELSRSKRDFDTAFKHYSKAVELYPNYIPARMRRAAILVDRGKGTLALKDVEFVLSKRPRNIQAAYFRALILAQANDIGGAQSALREAGQLLLGLESRDILDDPQTLLISGIIHYYQRNYDTAFEQLSRIVKLQPSHAGARKLLGRLLLRKGEPKKAVRILRPAVEVAPKDAELLAIFADALMKDGQHREATEIFSRATALAPNAAGLRTRLALTRLISGGTDQEIEKDLNTALKVAPNSGTANSLLIMTHLKGGNFKLAKTAADEAIARSPANPHLYFLLGGALAGLRDLQGARAAFEDALNLYPNFASALINLAKLQIKMGEVAVAKERLEAFLTSAGENTDVMLVLADIAFREKDVAEAIRWVEKARSLKGDDLKPHLVLVQLYASNKQTRKATEVAREVSARFPGTLEVLEVSVQTEQALFKEMYSPDDRGKKATSAAKQIENLLRRMSKLAAKQNSTAWLNKVIRHQIEQRDFDGAHKTVQTTILIDNENIPANVSLFQLLIRKGEMEAARQHATRLISTLPQSPIGEILLGDINMIEKHYEDAADAYFLALGKQESSLVALKLFHARRATGRNALEFIEKWVADHSEDRDATQVLAAVYSRSGRHKDAIQLYQKLTKIRPNDPGLMNSLALLYDRKGDISRALTHAEKAYKLAPNSPSIIDTLGWLHIQNGNLVYGLKLLKNAEIRAPKVPEIHFHIGVALNRMGQTKEALKYLRKALNLSETFDGAENARALLSKISGG